MGIQYMYKKLFADDLKAQIRSSFLNQDLVADKEKILW
jgi:hypothetical protein